MKKIILFCLIIVILFSYTTVSAEEVNLENYYEFTSNISESLPNETENILNSLGIDYLNQNSFSELKFNNIFNVIFKIFKQEQSVPITNGIFIICIILISSSFSGITNNKFLNNNNIFEYITAIIIIVSTSYNLIELLVVTESGINNCSKIIVACIPVLSGIMLTVGKVSISGVICSTMILLPELISQIIISVIFPLVKISFAIGISSSVSPNFKISKIIDFFRKLSTWILTFLISVFIFIFGSQTIIASSTDNITTKTAKFIVGSWVPVIGSSVSEAVSTVTSCMNVLKNTISVYIVFAVVCVFLPIIIELILWKFSLFMGNVVSDTVGNEKVSNLLENINKTLSFIIAVIISIIIMFIFAVTLVTVGVGI